MAIGIRFQALKLPIHKCGTSSPTQNEFKIISDIIKFFIIYLSISGGPDPRGG